MKAGVCGLILAALPLAACTDDEVIEIGTPYYDNGTPRIEVPATVRAGATFGVRVTTAGGGCISGDRTDVDVAADGAIVTPYDRRHIPGEHEGCLLNLVPIEHETSVTFATPGAATLHVRMRTSASNIQPPVLTDVPLSITVE